MLGSWIVFGERYALLKSDRTIAKGTPGSLYGSDSGLKVARARERKLSSLPQAWITDRPISTALVRQCACRL